MESWEVVVFILLFSVDGAHDSAFLASACVSWSPCQLNSSSLVYDELGVAFVLCSVYGSRRSTSGASGDVTMATCAAFFGAVPREKDQQQEKCLIIRFPAEFDQ